MKDKEPSLRYSRIKKSPKRFETTNPFATKNPLKWGAKIDFEGHDVIENQILTQDVIYPYFEKLKSSKIKRKVLEDIKTFEESLISGDDGGRIVRGVSTVFGLFDKSGRTYFLFGDVHNNKQQCGSITRAYSPFPHITDVVSHMMDKQEEPFTDIFAEIFFKYNKTSSIKYHWQHRPLDYLLNNAYRQYELGGMLYFVLDKFFTHGVLPPSPIIYWKILESIWYNISYPYQPASNIYQLEKMFSGCFEKDKSGCPKKYSKVARFHYTDIRMSDKDSELIETKFNTGTRQYVDFYRDFGFFTNKAVNFLTSQISEKYNSVKQIIYYISGNLDQNALLYNLYFQKCLLIIILLFSPNEIDELTKKLIKSNNFNSTLIDGIHRTRKELKSIEPTMSLKIRRFIGLEMINKITSPPNSRGISTILKNFKLDFDPIGQTLNKEWFENLLTTKDSLTTIYDNTLQLFYNQSKLKRNLIYRLNIFSMRILFQTSSSMMDLYTLSRMFKHSLTNSKRVMIFAGVAHVFNYAKFLKEELGCCLFSKSQTFLPYFSKSAYVYASDLLYNSEVGPESSCVNIPELTW